MRKLLTVLLIIASCQLSAWASDKVIVELGPNARASAVAAAVGGEVLESIPGSSQVLLKVPSIAAAAAFAHTPQSGIVSVELNDAVTIRPTGGLGILKLPASKPAQWYSRQPAFKLVRVEAAQGQAKGRGVVVADLNSRVDYGHPA